MYTQKVVALRPTDAILVNDVNGEHVVLYKPSRKEIRRAKLSSISVYTDAFLAQGSDLASYAWQNAPQQKSNRNRFIGQVENNKQFYVQTPAPTPAPPAPITQPATVVQNAPKLYNPGLANTSPAAPTNNPLLAQ